MIKDPRISAAETVIFDLDDTLIPTVHPQAQYLAHLTRDLAKASGKSEDQVMRGFRKVFRTTGMFETERAMDAHEELIEAAGGRKPSEAFASVREKLDAEYRDEIKPDADTIEGLKALKASGKRLAIYTESQSSSALYKLRTAGLDSYFDAVFAPRAGEVTPADNPNAVRLHNVPDFPKDDAETLKGVVRTLYPDEDFATSRNKVVMVGDNICRDIKRASEAGVPAVHTTQFRKGGSGEFDDALTIAWQTGASGHTLKAAAQTFWTQLTYTAPNVIHHMQDFAHHVMEGGKALVGQMVKPGLRPAAALSGKPSGTP